MPARTRLILIALVAAALTGGCLDVAATASAAAGVPSPVPGVLGITPARRNVVARPPQDLGRTLIHNTTKVTYDVTVRSTLLIQQLNGSFEPDLRPPDLNAAQLIMNVSPTHFTMKPGDGVYVNLHWNLLPRRARAAYVGLLVTGTPKSSPTGQGLNSILQILGTNFFRLPGAYRSGAKIVGLRGEQAAPKVLRFVTSVKNVGQVAESPHHARLKIVDGRGRVRARARWLGALILPGYTREFPLLLKKVLPAGNYTAITSMTFGRNGPVQTRRYPFRLAGPNQLPTRKLALRGGSASGEIGKPAKLGFRVANVGSAVSPVVTDVFLERLRTGRSSVIAGRRHIAYGTIAIGATKRYVAQLGKVDAGSYRVIVRLSDGKTFFDQLIAGFTAKRHKGFLGRFGGWLGDHIAVIIAALSLLGLLAALFLLLLMRRRLRDEDEETAVVAQPMAPAPAAPAVPVVVPVAASRNGDGVDINRAAIAELMTLPGLGRLAASRIVEFREANGPFSSLDQLNRIEGFHAERIERLRGVARV